jgi:ligand-binding SRPBCC domain-containing protein
MTVQTLHKEQLIKKPIKEVFAFFEKPENLAIITPPSLGFQILTPLPIEMKDGALIDYTIRLRGIPVRWTTMVTDYDPPHKFVDVQIRGPYAFWHHTHMFKQVDDGTIMTDIVQYILPCGLLGRFVHAFSVEGQLKNIFEYRARKIEEYFPIDIADAPSAEMLKKAAQG